MIVNDASIIIFNNKSIVFYIYNSYPNKANNVNKTPLMENSM